jgi:hypothetical protein
MPGRFRYAAQTGTHYDSQAHRSEGERMEMLG